MTPFAGAVLCGGASRRMGRDKALLELDGRALARRVADALRAAGADPVVAIGGDVTGLARWQLPVVTDDHPGEGPLGGVLTALRFLRPASQVAVLACDLVDPDPAAIRALVDAMATTGTAPHVAVPVAGGRRHFHHAVWHRRAAEPIRVAFEAGERAPRRIAEALRVIEVTVARPEALGDVDDPAAFQRLQRSR